MTIADSAHVSTAKMLRQQYHRPLPAPKPPNQESLVRGVGRVHLFGVIASRTGVLAQPELYGRSDAQSPGLS
jgi:hypothetical protein